MNHRIVATLGAFVLLLLTAVPALGHDAVASCGALQLINGTRTADVTRTDVDPDVLVRDDVPGTGTQTGLAAGIYSIEWDDGFTVAGVVVTACEQVTQPTPTPTPEVSPCDGPCTQPTPTPPQRIPCTSNPAVLGPPCPDPTPTPTPLTSPSPSASTPPSEPPSATPVATPDVPKITLPPTETGVAPATDSNTIVGLVFVIAAMAGVLVAVWPRRARP